MTQIRLFPRVKRLKQIAGIFGAVLSLLVLVIPVQAYTVMTGKWASYSTTYVRDSSYNNQGSGWPSMFDTAASNWTTFGAFGFYESTSSSNHIQAANIASSCGGCLALTSVYNNPINQFTVVVNIGSGYAFYDGTQGGTIPPNYYDLQSIMRHELGHAQGLCHSSNSSYLMYRAFSTGQVKPLDTDAKNGSKYLYMAGYTGPGPEGPCSLS